MAICQKAQCALPCLVLLSHLFHGLHLSFLLLFLALFLQWKASTLLWSSWVFYSEPVLPLRPRRLTAAVQARRPSVGPMRVVAVPLQGSSPQQHPAQPGAGSKRAVCLVATSDGGTVPCVVRAHHQLSRVSCRRACTFRPVTSQLTLLHMLIIFTEFWLRS